MRAGDLQSVLLTSNEKRGLCHAMPSSIRRSGTKDRGLMHAHMAWRQNVQASEDKTSY